MPTHPFPKRRASRTTPLLLLLLAGGSLACGSGTGAHAVVQTSTDIPVNGATQLSLFTAGGQISVGPGPEGTVHIDITRRALTEDQARALIVTTSQSADKVIAEWTGAAGDDSVSFSVQAPLTMLGLEAAADGGGDVTVHDRSGVLRLRTGAGRVTTDNTTGDLSAISGGGPIQVARHTGKVEATTGAGSITIAGTLTGLSSALATGGGNIDVTVPGDSNLVISAETEHGLASNDFGLPVVTSQARQSFQGSIGSGAEGTLSLQTLGGEVALHQSR